MKKTIVLITAKHHSGKSFFATEIQRLLKGKAEVHTGRKMIEESLEKQNLEITRQSVRDEGARLSNIHTVSGFGVVIDAMMEKIEQSSVEVHLIVAVYYPKAIASWKKFAEDTGYSISIVALNTSDEIRLAIARAKTGNPDFSLEDLAIVDALENTGDPNRQQLDVCLAQADTVVENTSTSEAFILAIDDFVKKRLLDQ